MSRRALLGIGGGLGAGSLMGLAGCSSNQSGSGKGGPSLIKWNEPTPMAKRLMNKGSVSVIPKEYVDKVKKVGGPDTTGHYAMLKGYQLPNGWKEATEGVTDLSVINGGSLEGDPATALGGILFEELTGFKFNWSFLSCADAQAKETTMFTSQSDSVQVPQTCAVFLYASLFGQSGWVQRNDDMWPADVQKLYAAGLPNIYKAPDGHFYGAPGVALHTFFLYYRPSWLKGAGVKVPTTWQELVTASGKVQKWAQKNVSPQATGLVMPCSEPTVTVETWGHPTYAMGKTIMNNGKAVIEPAVWQLLVDLVNKGGLTKGLFSADWPAPAEAFGKGTTGFAIDYDVYLGQFASSGQTQAGSTTAAIKNDWAVAPMPAWEGVGKRSRGQLRIDGWQVSAFASPAQRAAGLLWLDFYRSYQAAFNEFVYEGNEPIMPSVYDDPNAKHSPIVKPKYEKMERDALDNQTLESFPPQMAEALMSFKAHLSDAISGKATVTKAREAAQDEIDGILEKK